MLTIRSVKEVASAPRNEAANEAIRAERRSAILQAAARVFARNGYVGTRIEDLAEAAGMSKGLLYHYFPSKEAVFATLVDGAARGAVALLRAAIDRPGPPSGRLRWLIEQQTAGLASSPHTFMVVLQALMSDAVPEEARRQAAALVADSERLLTALVAQGAEGGDLVSGAPRHLVILLAMCMQGIAVAAASPSLWSAVPTAESVIALFLRPPAPGPPDDPPRGPGSGEPAPPA
jgi:AcrR family transcriptional regulator